MKPGMSEGNAPSITRAMKRVWVRLAIIADGGNCWSTATAASGGPVVGRDSFAPLLLGRQDSHARSDGIGGTGFITPKYAFQPLLMQ
jgi:hypothetical protein